MTSVANANGIASISHIALHVQCQYPFEVVRVGIWIGVTSSLLVLHFKFHVVWHAAYIGRMKERTSITLSSDVLAKVDRLAGSNHSRSAVIEHILRLHFRERSLRKIHARDLKRINAAATRLNSEAEDVLTYQALKD
jgi:hypothetical protein